MSICPHCGIGFNKWQDYSEHLDTNHRHLVANPRGLPGHARNTSGRTKAQIVSEAEASWLGPLLVTASNEVEHLEACRCHTCWLRMADKLIKSQEECI